MNEGQIQIVSAIALSALLTGAAAISQVAVAPGEAATLDSSSSGSLFEEGRDVRKSLIHEISQRMQCRDNAFVSLFQGSLARIHEEIQAMVTSSLDITASWRSDCRLEVRFTLDGQSGSLSDSFIIQFKEPDDDPFPFPPF